jgi:HAMP domain-containing protein
MKIRTWLLLSLLPALLGVVALIFVLLEQSWNEQMQISQTLVISAFLVIAAAIALYFIAGNISTPIQKLNNSALDIAAGHYGESIQVKGPKELQELANTLNTMSQCLLENINRLKDNATQQQAMADEAQCARLLQHLMLQKNIDECSFDSIAVKAIAFSSSTPKGIRIDFLPGNIPETIGIHLAEAKIYGLNGIYQLLTQYKPSMELKQKKLSFPCLRITLHLESGELSVISHRCAMPYLWSMSNLELSRVERNSRIQAGDFLFLMNYEFETFLKTKQSINNLFNRVLKHFTDEGLETTVSMLQKELSFVIKKREFTGDLYLICIQILTFH